MGKPKLETVSGLIHEDDAATATGYSVERLYQLSQVGKIPARVEGCYDGLKLLAGISSYMREQSDKRTDNLGQVKLERERQKLRHETVKADEAEGKLVDVEQASEMNGHYFTEIVQRAMTTGPAIARLCVNQTADEIAARIQDSLKGIFADLPRMKMLPDESKKKVQHLLYTKNGLEFGQQPLPA